MPRHHPLRLHSGATAALSLLLACSVACGGAAPASSGGGDDPSVDVQPTGRLPRANDLSGTGERTHADVRAVRYHGGRVLHGEVGVYFIWYGSWPAQGAREILPDLVRGLAGSGYLAIHRSYADSGGHLASDTPALRGSSVDAYSHGKTLGDVEVMQIVAGAIASRALPFDPGALYFVLASSDVSETSGFCSTYCGFHQHTRLLGQTVRYSFVGSPERCMPACAAQPTGPNGDAAADAMASVVAHELSEAFTDPDFDAWYDSTGSEDADKCAWTFGPTHAAANGARANVRLGARDFLLPQLWLNRSGGYCALALE